MTYNMHGTCWQCGQQLRERDYAREALCPGCARPTHVCRNCRHYSTAAADACREPMADPVADKQRANFCGYFEAGSPQASGQTDTDALRKAAEDLFDL